MAKEEITRIADCIGVPSGWEFNAMLYDATLLADISNWRDKMIKFMSSCGHGQSYVINTCYASNAVNSVEDVH